MILDKKIVVVMPAYNAEKTLRTTVEEIDCSIVDEIVLVDDCSNDKTEKVAKELAELYPIHYIRHKKNLGYGGNQKTCYRKALDLGADIVVMLHPDYQYTPKLLPAMASLLVHNTYDIALGSRIIGGGALKGGMPPYKYFANRVLTLLQNIGLGLKLSEYHTGYRAFSKKILTSLPLENNSNDFIFDNQMLVQSHYFGFRIGEISCPTKYFDDASSINFSRSLKYGFGCLWTTLLYILAKVGISRSAIFEADQKTLQSKNIHTQI